MKDNTLKQKPVYFICYYLISIIGIIGTIFGLFGVSTNFERGILVLCFALLLSAVIFNITHYNRSRLARINLEDYLKNHALEKDELKCMFSSADGLRKDMESLIPKLKNSIHVNFTVKLILRNRKDTNLVRVQNNIVRLHNILSEYNIKFLVKYIEWDYFMINGIIADEKEGIVGFYYRKNNNTFRIDDEYLLVNKNRSDTERILYEGLNKTFDSIWDTAPFIDLSDLIP